MCVSVVDAVARNHARHVPAVVPGGGGSAFGGLNLQALRHGTGEAARAAEPTHVQGHAGMLTLLDALVTAWWVTSFFGAFVTVNTHLIG